MYNGIGLQTARGSGTNGYIQSNKFFVKTRVSKVLTDPSSIKGFESGQGTAGVTRKPNKDILEHDRKRQIELKLLVLEEKLTDQGYTDSEIAEKLQEVRLDLEDQAAADEDGGAGAIVSSDRKVSDTQSHQVAARKEKQMETLRAALGIGVETENQKKDPDVPLSDLEDISNDDKPIKSRKKDAPSVKKHGKDVLGEKDDTLKGVNDKRVEAISKKLDEPKRHKNGSRRGRRGESSETDASSSETDSDGKAVKASKKKHRRSAHSSESDDEPDAGDRKRRQKFSARKKKNRRHDSDYSDSESDTESDSDSSSDSEPDRKYGKSLKRQDSDDDSRSDQDSKYKSQKAKIISRRGRYDSEDESSSDAEKKDKINHSEKRKNGHRSAFRSDKDGMARDDHKVGKGRRDNADARYGSKSDSESDKALKGKNIINMSRRRHDIDEDESSLDREKKYRKNYSEKKRNEQQSAFRLEKDDIVHDTHTVSKGRRSEISRRYDRKSDSDEAPRRKSIVEDSRRRHDDRKSDSDSDEAPRWKNRVEDSRRRHDDRKSDSESDEAPKRKNRVEDSKRRHDDRKSDSESDEAPRRKNRVEDSRRRHDSDEDESDYDKKKKFQKTRRRDSDEDDGGSAHDTSSESDASEGSDRRLGRNERTIKSLEKNGRQPDDLDDKGRKAGGKAYEREDDEKIKHKRASQKVDDGSDTLSKLEKLYQSREEKIDSAGYGRSKRKMDDGNRDEQPERKSRRHDLGSETEFTLARSKPDSKRSPDRWGTTQSGVEVHNERGRPGQDAKERQGRKHRRDEEEDVIRKHGRDRDHQQERHRREEEDHLSSYKRDRDLDSSKRARYDDSGSSRRRYDDDKHDDRRSRR